MRVLMISLDGSLLGDPHGDTVRRHIEYARRIGNLAIVTYNPASERKTPRRFSGELTVYPTNVPTPYLFPWYAVRVARSVHREQPADVITTQDPFATGPVGLWLKWRTGLPLNVQSHSTFFTNPDWIAERPLRNRLLRLIGKFVVQRADTHRVLTDYEKDVYVRLGIPAERITVLNVPVPVENFNVEVPDERRIELRRALDIIPDAPVAVWVGLPVKFKHMELLLDAFALVHAALPAARLVLVGDFSDYPQYVRCADPDYVCFTGRIPHEDLPAYYALADVYVHSSRYEGVPRVLIEALASARPVVSTRHVGSETIVRDGETGLLCDHTPRALADAALVLLTDPDRAQAMGQAGREDVLVRYAYERQMNAIVDTYRATLDARR
ncbi:MAG: glycosyltransferase family 4 protein [Anaerolineae bacterium]|nr:glycosyltransferase family 4 protein [Anaerolineae bacterium]